MSKIHVFHREKSLCHLTKNSETLQDAREPQSVSQYARATDDGLRLTGRTDFHDCLCSAVSRARGYRRAPLIHAHFPELEIAENERVVHMEARHSHSQARPIDILTTTAPSVTQFDVIIVAVSLSPPAVEVCCGFVSLDRPRAPAPLRWRTSFLALLPPDIFPVSDA